MWGACLECMFGRMYHKYVEMNGEVHVWDEDLQDVIKTEVAVTEVA